MCLRMLSKHLLNSVRLGAGIFFPGEPVPVPNHPLGEKPFPDIESKPPLTQFQAIPLGPVTGYQGKEINVFPFSSPHEEVADCNEVSPQSSLLQAEQTKSSQHS
ncbi:hypothetical protein HGM15179_004301 [Zosterops borbonicus]|uniref:Uncharacterized protein n=1 Tax=Zosterops borbonicus TaxID=364589 RepID=A0A8K1GPA6_9PASS|nr:hypothetical protein HGM15179_004301 [Zosterops borbonicus]